MNVYLIGMPGSGKTSVGRRLAGSLGLRFVDLDEAAASAAGKPIPRVFAEDGEDRFRELESEALRRSAAGSPAVVACGGGVVTRPENLETLSRGTVVYLRAPAAVLLRRVRLGGDRPLLRDEGDLERLLAGREASYRAAADMVIDAEGEPDEVASRVQEALA